LEIVGPKGFAFVEKKYQRVIRTKHPLEYTSWSEVPAGRRAFEVRLIPIMNTVGECVQILALTRDVTELAELREQVKRLRKLAGI
jgi:hypothetical protein